VKTTNSVMQMAEEDASSLGASHISSIRSRDLKEAFRGLESPHAEIRIHAAIVLGKDNIPRVGSFDPQPKAQARCLMAGRVA
jgi:hypothetical protein